MTTSPLCFDTPLGEMIVIASETGIQVADFVDRKDVERATQRCAAAPASTSTSDDLAIQARDQLLEYFAGQRQMFDFPLAPFGTAFQNRCWHALRQIPFGQTISYANQATDMGAISAIRAVANANGQNFCAIVIPCHRVIGSNGDLRGYGGGLNRKRWLIDHERALVNDAVNIPSTLFTTR